MFPPYVDDVGLQGAAGGTVVVEARHAAVDFEGGRVEEAAAEEGVEDLPVEGLAGFGRGGVGGHGFDGSKRLVFGRERC